MQKKWRKTGAALLIAGLTISGTGYALAEGGKVTEVVDLSELDKNAVEEKEVIPVREVPIDETSDVTALETEKKEETTQSDEADGTTDSSKEEGNQDPVNDELPEIPEGYTAGNLAALSKAYEQAGSPTAKAAIKRNMERSIAKWESEQPVVESPEEEVKVEAPATEEQPKVEESVKEETPVKKEKPAKVKEKNPQAELNAKHKEQKEALKAAQKAEREALKEERKAAKEDRKAAKEQQKKDKKEKKH